ncbi:hypothetical protein [Rhodopila sp.]|uniref:hypothetical protein n=1 Tax=Rhodopila sp. TaxID=2480087 RepID=UPI003D0DBD6E
MIEYLIEYKEITGLITLILSAFGFVLSLLLWAFIRRSRAEIARSMSRVYLADSMMFLITACFGMSGAFNAGHTTWTIIYFIRPFVIACLIWALWRQYRNFRKIGKRL